MAFNWKIPQTEIDKMCSQQRRNWVSEIIRCCGVPPEYLENEPLSRNMGVPRESQVAQRKILDKEMAEIQAQSPDLTEKIAIALSSRIEKELTDLLFYVKPNVVDAIAISIEDDKPLASEKS